MLAHLMPATGLQRNRKRQTPAWTHLKRNEAEQRFSIKEVELKKEIQIFWMRPLFDFAAGNKTN